MRCIRFGVGMLLLLVGGASAVAADAEPAILWQDDVNEAWKTSQAQQRPMLLFVTASGCAYCSKMKRETYADRDVIADVSRHFVPATVDAGGQTSLIEKLGVRVFPTTLIIAPNAELLDAISGYVPAETLRNRIAGANQRLKQSAQR